MGDLTKNFSRSEFACPCCGDDKISHYAVNALQLIRNAVGAPLSIESGVRCSAHNEAIGGVENSSHVPADKDDGEGIVGHAVDIKCITSTMRFKIIKEATKYFTRIGIGRNFVHLDNDTGKPQGVLWHYYKT
jgi:zinc D-Ala-D-Ala carboxypeptidase